MDDLDGFHDWLELVAKWTFMVGCLVATGAIGSMFNIDVLVPAALSLIASVSLIVLATLFYALEVRLSLHALSLAITDLKSHRERKDPSSC